MEIFSDPNSGWQIGWEFLSFLVGGILAIIEFREYLQDKQNRREPSIRSSTTSITEKRVEPIDGTSAMVVGFICLISSFVFGIFQQWLLMGGTTQTTRLTSAFLFFCLIFVMGIIKFGRIVEGHIERIVCIGAILVGMFFGFIL